MLALETGWTPDILRALPAGFRARCHWALYARTMSGPDGIPDIEIPAGADSATRLSVMKARVEIAAIRSLLFPEDQ